MKKYDKVTSRNTLQPYMKMVDNSYLGSSDEVTKLIEMVESEFIKHFSNSNRQKGMAVLRPKPKIERHRITFFMGCFAGCTVALTLALILLVTLPDFFLADQLTSQVQAIRSLQFYICYYGWGDYKLRVTSCRSSDVFKTFNFIVACIPYWSRLLQCLRRLFEEKDPHQALYGTYWDLVVDWGLLHRNSKNRWLRDKLVIPYKSVYFGAMVLNVLLRFAWLQTVLDFEVPFMHKETMSAVVASLEIIRRGIWSFFRLENEHLNNVGKYRAFKSVPLPFNYDEDHKDL
ncbi:hypothetical protein ACLB2K_042935 [Fragaria x ananassa]